MKTLYIYIDEKWPESGGELPLKWALADKNGRLAESGETKDFATLPDAERVEAIAPASVVTLTRVKLPPRNRRRFLKALANAVEDQVVSDPDSLHVVPGTQTVKDELPVAVISKEWIGKTLELMRQNGIAPSIMIAETLLAPVENGQWSVFWDGDKGFVRTGEYSGLAFEKVDANSPPAILSMLINEERARNKLPGLVKIFAGEKWTADDLKTWRKALKIPLTISSGYGWEKLACLQRHGAINLLKGEFSPIKAKDVIKRLKVTIALALTLGLVYFGSGIAEWMKLRNEERALLTEMTFTFKKAFPAAVAVVDPPLQMRRNLDDLKYRAGESGHGLVPMLSKVSIPFSETVKMRGFEYEEGELKLSLLIAEKNQAEELSEKISKLGFSVTMNEIAENDGEVEVTYLIKSQNR